MLRDAASHAELDRGYLISAKDLGAWEHLDAIAEAFAGLRFGPSDERAFEAAIAERFATVESVSVDYAVLEVAPNVVTIEAAFDWDDLGAWPALARHVRQDESGNAAVGQLIHVDAARNHKLSRCVNDFVCSDVECFNLARFKQCTDGVAFNQHVDTMSTCWANHSSVFNQCACHVSPLVMFA